MKFLRKANINPFCRIISLILFAALINLSASVFQFQEEAYKITGHGTSFYESEGPIGSTPVSSRVEKRTGSPAGVQVLTIIAEKPSSLNKIKLLYKSFQPRDFHPVRERSFLTAKFSTDT